MPDNSGNKCPYCGCCVVIKYSSLNKKVCWKCKEEWLWELSEGQEPLIKYQR